MTHELATAQITVTKQRALVSPELAVERTSTIFSRLVRETTTDSIEVRTIVEALKDRSFGMLMIMFAVPNAVIPGISWILGAPIVLIGLQLAAGRRTLWLPDFMLRQRLSRDLFLKIASRVTKFLVWVENLMKPRFGFMTTPLVERLLGVFLSLTAIVLMMPIPWGNALPAFGIAFISIGIIERDGLAIIAGIVLGILGAIFVAAFGGAVLYAALKILNLY
jgi:hypothetical protein